MIKFFTMLRDRIWPQMTVASVTAEFNKVVKDLESIQNRSWIKANFHREMTKLHDEEAVAAARIGAKIKELVG